MNTSNSKSQRIVILKRLVGISLLMSVGIIIFMIFIHKTFTTNLQDERKNQTLHLSTVATEIIGYFYKLELVGELSHEQAQKYAMQSIQSATYGDNGYFWINNSRGVLLMQPYTPDKVGVNQIDWMDGNGKFVFQEFIKTAKDGGGWVSYCWPKPQIKKEYPKISYINYFKPWDWVVGTGVYLDDMRTQIFTVVTKTSGMLFAAFLMFMTVSFLFVNFYFRKLGELSVRDPLTNLYTQRFLTEIIPSILRKHTRTPSQVLGVTFVDIDHFKIVNDTYGHNCGDMVLQQIANLLIHTTRADDYCIRYGGEEFVVVGFYEDKQAAFDAIERIRESISLFIFRSRNSEFSITLSAGIAFYDGSLETFEETIKRADQQLYRSKQSGRNRTSM